MPLFLDRYSPGSMRTETTGSRLNSINSFSLNRLENNYNFETGLTGTFGFDYKLESTDKKLDLSVAQIVNQKENKKMHSKTSLDEKLSDLVGNANLKLGNNFNLNYEFSLDQNYKEFNFNEISTSMNLDHPKLILVSCKRKNTWEIRVFTTKFNYENRENGLFSFEVKRNLITNSAEFYNLSYEYINDCLRAGLVYRREFYNDSELEPENSLYSKLP